MRETDKYMRATDVFGAFVYVERMEVWRNTLISRTKEKEINSNETKSEWVSEGRDGGGGQGCKHNGFYKQGFLEQIDSPWGQRSPQQTGHNHHLLTDVTQTGKSQKGKIPHKVQEEEVL